MFQFSIRDLFWLTVVVALGVLWWGEVRQRRIDGAELWAKKLRLSEQVAHSITLLADEYQKRTGCDVPAARMKAERRMAGLLASSTFA
jgi:hypothetical protein